MGKGKIETKRIADKSECSADFSERRQDLFKEAAELDALCGSRTSVVSVSDSGDVFTAGPIGPVLVPYLLSSQGSMDLEKLGTEQLGALLDTLENVQLLLKKKEEESATNLQGNQSRN